ncbi:ferroportin-like [Clavelina lepadiformis]|uniref:Solute carrier family 40 member n=1 Tax=Clavelina lepadiformis TaxID=159417 RepID=A0ABP0F8C4_CLALP
MVKTSTIIYCGHFFSSWGDRMWYFAIPLFLFDLDPKSLSLSAIYGLVLACSVLVFGPLVGEWIDRNKRLYTARVSLIIQNTSVILSATILLVHRLLGNKNDSFAIWVQIGAIITGAIGNLASVATGIIIQKDWIVVVAGGKKDLLADLNSMVRRIDLTTKIISPLACGQIMAWAGLTGGAIFIVSWNALSMVVEYLLLRAVYVRTPALANKNKETENEGEEMRVLNDENMEQDDRAEETPTNKEQPQDSEKNETSKKKKSIFRKMFSFVFMLKDGWKLYLAQPISLPCIGFSFLYMTILGFGYITIAYAYSQCFSEFMVGILQAGAALAGVIATFIFPPMREKVGLLRTGLFCAFFQISTLIPCLVSIFIAGSPFMWLPENMISDAVTNSNMTLEVTTPLVDLQGSNYSTMSSLNTSVDGYTTMPSLEEEDIAKTLFLKCVEGVSPPSSYQSITLLMAGIILARVGLWGFDLTITQLIQENVVEKERGVFNGVQSSLNNFMDLLRYFLVLCLPLPSQFGILVVLSSLAVCVGYILYMAYSRRVRGHILPHCTKVPIVDATNALAA